MLNSRSKLNQEFRVNRITGHEERSDIMLNIHKRREFVAYRAHVSAQNALVLTSQVGVHPNNIKDEVSILLDCIKKFNDGMSTSQITKLIKENYKKILKISK